MPQLTETKLKNSITPTKISNSVKQKTKKVICSVKPSFQTSVGAGRFRLRNAKPTRTSSPFRTLSDPTLSIHFETTINVPFREKLFTQVLVTLAHTKTALQNRFA